MKHELEIRLLGDFQILRSGKPAELPHSRKTRALMAYLIATGRPFLREHLCDMFWDHPYDPRAALRWSLSKIRPLLNDSVIRLQTVQNRVVFIPDDVSTDISEIYSIARNGLKKSTTSELSAITEYFTGDFLEGLNLPECYRFQAWCTNERETMRSFQIACLSELAMRLANHPEEALHYTRLRIALDPLNEEAHTTAIRLLGQMGRIREALEQYETCTRILVNELNMQPSRMLQAERASLGRKIKPLTGDTFNSEKQSLKPDFPVIGRRSEIEIFHRFVKKVSDGDEGGILFLTGEEGMGKTRLLSYLADYVQSLNGNVIFGRAFETEMIRSYGPWINALENVSPVFFPQEVKKELYSLLPGMGPVSGKIRQNHLFYAVLRLLQKLAADTGLLVIILDDLHWFDEASAAMLHYTAQIVSGSPALIILAARKNKLDHNPYASRLLKALKNEYKVYPMELAPLSASETSALVQTIDPSLDPARIFYESQGNPFFVHEISNSLLQYGDTVTEALDEMIKERLSELDEGSRDLLTWASLVGHTFSLDVLGGISGISEENLLESLDILEQKGLIRYISNDKYEFVYDMFRIVASRHISETRKRLAHLRSATANDDNST